MLPYIVPYISPLRSLDYGSCEDIRVAWLLGVIGAQHCVDGDMPDGDV